MTRWLTTLTLVVSCALPAQGQETAGGTLLSTKQRPVPALDDLPGKIIAVIEGTTTEAALRHFGEVNEYDFSLRLIETHDEGMKLLTDGDVDGYASAVADRRGDVRVPGRRRIEPWNYFPGLHSFTERY